MVSRLNYASLDAAIKSPAETPTVVSSGGSSAVPSTVVSAPTVKAEVTSEIIDSAVEKVLSRSKLSESAKEAFRRMLASDSDSNFSTAYQLGQAREDYYVASTKLKRRELVVRYAVSAEETSDLVRYAPEYDLRFTGEENHDHAVAAAMRKIDTQVLLDAMPKIRFKDIGGDPLLYIMLGMSDAHVCDPFEDAKDPTRATMRMLRARKIRDDESWPSESRVMASRYIQRDPTFVCGKRGQDCHHKAKFTIAAHVYDIPIQDWPRIMKNSDAVVHTGTIHFSSDMYSRTSGEMAVSRAYYEIDLKNDRFHMGFSNSPSWWYSHSWMRYMRYGVDQIVETNYGRYSYKVTQRRGDTYYYEVLRVGNSSLVQRQVYAMPVAKMVKVHGFEMDDKKSWDMAQGKNTRLSPRVWWFPQSLWHDMLTQAEIDFERGVMTFDKLYNYYRTVSPRNTINGVLLSGGNAVEKEYVLPLVVHVGLAAAARVMLGQRESRVLTAHQMALRVRKNRSLFNQVMSSFLAVVKGAVKVLLSVVRWLMKMLVGLTDDMLIESLVQWANEPDIEEVEFSSLIGKASPWMKERWKELQFEEVEASVLEPAQNSIAGDHLRALEQADGLRDLVEELYGFKEPGEEGIDKKPETVVTAEDQSTLVEYVPSDAEVLERRAAIQESIEEAKLEQDKLLEHCANVWRVCLSSNGQPNVHLLRERAEEYGQPDFWFINGGIIGESVLGQSFEAFRHAAVYTFKPDGEFGSNFRTVREQYVGNGKKEVEYKVIADNNYFGWGLTLDRLLIYNGPEVQDALTRALDMPHNYKITLQQGPPGCGKTYAIIQALQHAEVAMCPVRESALDTRTQMIKKDPTFPDPKNRISTVDSYLVNLQSKSKAKLEASKLRADECYMTSAGRWYAVAALLGVREIVAYGDINQIPHIPRVQAASLYLRISPTVVECVYLIYRCPADALAAWGHVYDWKVRTVSQVRRSMTTCRDWQSLAIPDGLVVLVMYQADKKEAKRILKSRIEDKRIRIMTTHESEGKTFSKVWLMRFDSRPRADGMSLYDQSPHCLVAMSRHTESFTYVRPVNMGDLVDRWMAGCADPRRIAAATEVATAGVSKEFL
uniref:RNA-dependent RNA polymerase n=1 Tax=Grapevine-associated virga-like virus 1 TaxID=2814373 RepID=A0A8F5MJI5_9VIRU|nr:MAG: RNA-dependent RNA polymerase [Grapevine-associated virga-like virus 1]